MWKRYRKSEHLSVWKSELIDLQQKCWVYMKRRPKISTKLHLQLSWYFSSVIQFTVSSISSFVMRQVVLCDQLHCRLLPKQMYAVKCQLSIFTLLLWRASRELYYICPLFSWEIKFNMQNVCCVWCDGRDVNHSTVFIDCHATHILYAISIFLLYVRLVCSASVRTTAQWRYGRWLCQRFGFKKKLPGILKESSVSCIQSIKTICAKVKHSSHAIQMQKLVCSQH